MENHKIISELYFNVVEDLGNKIHAPENLTTRMRSHDVVTELEKVLNGEEKVLLEKLLDLWMSMEVTSNEESFILGFRLEARLMDEILEKDSSQS